MSRFSHVTTGRFSLFFDLAERNIEVNLIWNETFQRTINNPIFNYFRINHVTPDLTIRVLVVNDKDEPLTLQDYEKSIPGISNKINWKCPFFSFREVLEYYIKNIHELDYIHYEGRENLLIIYNLWNKEIVFFSKENGRENLSSQGLNPEIFAPFLAAEQGFFIHSSGVVRENGAAIFLAPDGGGKTTVANSVPTESVLCDDQVILKYKQERFFAYPTPWGRISGRREAAPVHGLYFIEKANSFRVTPIHPIESIERIWDDNSRKLALLPAKMRSQVFDLVCKAAREIKSYRLETLPGGVDWRVIDECLASGLNIN
jgi:hypothetical protein